MSEDLVGDDKVVATLEPVDGEAMLELLWMKT